MNPYALVLGMIFLVAGMYLGFDLVDSLLAYDAAVDKAIQIAQTWNTANGPLPVYAMPNGPVFGYGLIGTSIPALLGAIGGFFVTVGLGFRHD